MVSVLKRVVSKIQRDGVKSCAKSVGRIVQSKYIAPDWDMDLVPALLQRLLSQADSLCIVQVGANIGNTESDQIFKFLKKHCGPGASVSPKVHALLIEPVRHLYDQLVQNYNGFHAVRCRNVAIAETAGTKPFYRLREGIDLAANGLPPFSHQLGSFVFKNMESLWDHDPKNEKLKKFALENIITEQIPCETLDQLLKDEQIDSVDLLQVDTEGYDYVVLKTLDFERLAPRFINYERIHLGKSEADCRRMLVQHGYSLHDHGQDTLCTANKQYGFLGSVKNSVYNWWLEAIN